MISKKELRKEILARRDALSSEERQQKSTLICKQVIEQKEFQTADKVLLFASFKSEVDTIDIFKEARRLRKDIYYPRVIGKEMEFYEVYTQEELREGYRGIREPEANPCRKISLHADDRIFVLMPGVAFDESGNRIGYGGGYYDKFLQQLELRLSQKNIYKIAIAYECQIVEVGMIENEEHDVKPDFIITEESFFYFNKT